ncbi:MAG: hypothetical protein GXO80_11255 [Chlorobi bacterium]|nr:hypothetical protein [Chlorobiota bacterium]
MYGKPDNIPDNSKYLPGIGASVFFHIEMKENNNLYRIRRFNEDGKLDCDQIFRLLTPGFDINSEFEFTYVSHCAKCTILQNDSKFIFVSLASIS